MTPTSAVWLPVLARAPVLALGDEAGSLARNAARRELHDTFGLSANLPGITAVVHQLDRDGGGTLRFGVNHRLTYVYDAPANHVQRVGALVVREFGGRRFGLRRPALVANVSYYLDDPFKRHQIGAAAALAFAVTR